MKILNQFRISGLQRSGNHAVTLWIMSQCEGDAILLNDVVPNTNPFLSMDEFVHYNSGRVLKHIDLWAHKENRAQMHAHIYDQITETFHLLDNLLFSYEDKSLKDVVSEYFENNYLKWIGDKQRLIDILIIRDPFNLFASRLKKGDTLTGIKNREELISIWKSYAKEFLGITNYLGKNRVSVNFNDWFACKKYRRKLAEKLGIKFSDQGLHSVSSIGGGSSFDGVSFQDQAQSMQVLNRWSHYAEDRYFKTFFKDKELLELSNAIFGEIIGTET